MLSLALRTTVAGFANVLGTPAAGSPDLVSEWLSSLGTPPVNARCPCSSIAGVSTRFDTSSAHLSTALRRRSVNALVPVAKMA